MLVKVTHCTGWVWLWESFTGKCVMLDEYQLVIFACLFACVTSEHNSTHVFNNCCQTFCPCTCHCTRSCKQTLPVLWPSIPVLWPSIPVLWPPLPVLWPPLPVFVMSTYQSNLMCLYKWSPSSLWWDIIQSGPLSILSVLLAELQSYANTGHCFQAGVR